MCRVLGLCAEPQGKFGRGPDNLRAADWAEMQNWLNLLRAVVQSVTLSIQEAEAGGSQVLGQSGQLSETLFQKIKRARGIAQW